MKDVYAQLQAGDLITGADMMISREKIAEFAEVTLDYNPLHLDEEFMKKTSFGKTKYEGIIGHGLLNFGLITRMMTDWLWPRGGIHRRLETKHVKPVYPGDRLIPTAKILRKVESLSSRWVIFEIELKKEGGETVVMGEATAEFPKDDIR
jgi:3-hydroxybutyryl-CoA dehydratase